jgi:hypothetical protein
MQEYITGRIKLSTCDASSKAIKEGKKSDAKQLSFVNEGGEIIVDAVPPAIGVRCGSAVLGFFRGESTTIQRVKWPNKAKKCTLDEVMEVNGISKADDTLVFKNDCTFCSTTVKVDTKEFGLPQTRQRTYMFVWRPENDRADDDLGKYFVKIVDHLKSHVRHSLDAFMLDDNHDVIRVFREALNGPPGRQSKRQCFLEPDFWSSKDANLEHNTNTRKALGLEDKARFFTNWGPFGKKQVPPTCWLEYLNCNHARIIDMIDILNASSVRDAER